MSLAFTRLVARKGKGLSRRANAVLRILADRADSKGRSFPSQERLAEATDGSVSTVYRALTELEQTGWITREKRWRRDGSRASDLITIRDEEAIARHVEAMLRLPLMVAIQGGGQGVDKMGTSPGISEIITGQSDRLITGQSDRPLTYHLDSTDHLRTGEAARAGEGAASPIPIPSRRTA